MIIGLTGQIGAGKTEAADVMADLGAKVIDADRIGRDVVDRSDTVRRQLVKAFGPDILDRRGRLNRSAVARKAFESPTGRDRLNRIVHPHLLRELRKQVRQAVKRYHVVVIDAALLLFWRMDKEVDLVLVIHAGREKRLARLERRGISRADARARERSQLPFSEFQKRADRVIMNSGSRRDLRRKVVEFYNRVVRRHID